MKKLIFQSKMNHTPPNDLGVRGNEYIVNEYISSLQFNSWIYFKDIPFAIRLDVINSLDTGIKGLKIIFDEMCERFFITREVNHLGLSLCLRKEHKQFDYGST